VVVPPHIRRDHHSAPGFAIRATHWNLKHAVIRLTWYDAGRDLGIVSVRYFERQSPDSL
jgi:hypothetical protein